MWTWRWRMERLHVSQGKGRADGKGSPWWLVRGGGLLILFPRETETQREFIQLVRYCHDKKAQPAPRCTSSPGQRRLIKSRRRQRADALRWLRGRKTGGVYCAIFGVPIIKVGSGLCFASVLGDGIFKWAAHKELRGRWRTSRANHSQKTWNCFERVA